MRASQASLGSRALVALLLAAWVVSCASDAPPRGSPSHAPGVVRVTAREARQPVAPPVPLATGGASVEDAALGGAESRTPDIGGSEGGAHAGQEPAPVLGEGAAENSGGTDAQEVSGGVGEPSPGCGKQLDGTECGGNMSPPGADDTRYFCSSGRVVAEARCPGACDPTSNACEMSDGTGQGDGDMGLNTPIRCRACYAALCRPELTACDGDPLCVAHMACFATCAYQKTCFATCRQVFSEEPLFAPLEACVGDRSCKELCLLP